MRGKQAGRSEQARARQVKGRLDRNRQSRPKQGAQRHIRPHTTHVCANNKPAQDCKDWETNQGANEEGNKGDTGGTTETIMR